MRVNAPRDPLTLRGKTPSVRLTLSVPLASVRQQPQALQTREQLGDLPLVADPRALSDHPVTDPRLPSDAHKHLRSAIRQTHPHLPQRITPCRQKHRPPTARHRYQPRPRTMLLTTRRPRTQIRQHDHSHQLTNKIHQRPRLTTRHPRIHNPERRTNQTLRRQRRTTLRARTPTTPSINHPRQTRKNLLTTRKETRTALLGMHHTHPRERRLTIKEPQNHPEAATHPLTPRKTLKTRPGELPLHHPQNIVQQRAKALLTVLKQLIERAPRHPRAQRDRAHRRTRVTQLLKRRKRARQQPRTLNPSQTPLRHRQPRRHPSTPPRTKRHTRHRRTTRSRTRPRSRHGPRTHRYTTPHGANGAIEKPRSPKGEPGRRENAKRRRPEPNPLAQEREREREMRQAADASSYTPRTGRAHHCCVSLSRNHAQSTPSSTTRSLSHPLDSPASALRQPQGGMTQPDSMYARQPHRLTMTSSS